MQQTPHLDMSVVAASLQCSSLKLQLKDQQMTEVSVKAASPLQPLDELRDLTGCDGSQDHPFLFSAGNAETGGHFQDDAVGLCTTFETLWMPALTRWLCVLKKSKSERL